MDEQPAKTFVKVNNATFTWINSPVLRNITLDLQKETLLCVAGPVGSGKSTLLMAVLNELTASEGSVEVQGRIAYASQV